MRLERLDNLKFTGNENLWTYVALKGTRSLLLKLEDEKRYVEERRRLLEDVASAKYNLNHVKEYLETVKDALSANGYGVKVCRIRALSRVLIGVSESFGKIPFEVGFFFDPVMNVPFIPGSSLKGVFRHALKDLLEREYLKEGLQPEEAEKEANEITEIIFGLEKWSGLVGVTDAYPVELGVGERLFEPDVITPHYQKAKTELDVRPNPVTFLTIAPGTAFEFYIYFNKELYVREHEMLKSKGERVMRKYPRAGAVNKLDTREVSTSVIDYAIFYGDLGRAVEELKDRGINLVNAILWVDRAVLYALTKGIGAKTNIGYSRFEVLEYKAVKV